VALDVLGWRPALALTKYLPFGSGSFRETDPSIGICTPTLFEAPYEVPPPGDPFVPFGP
jgi:hypothetical protein